MQTSILATVSQEKIDELNHQDSELSRLKAAFLANIQDPLVIAVVCWLLIIIYYINARVVSSTISISGLIRFSHKNHSFGSVLVFELLKATFLPNY